MKDIKMAGLFAEAMSKLTAELKAWRDNCANMEIHMSRRSLFKRDSLSIEVVFKDDNEKGP